MNKRQQTEYAVDPAASEYSLRRPSLRMLGGGRDKYLTRLGIRNLHDLLEYEPVQYARTLAAVSRGLIPKSQLAGLVKEEFIRKDAVEALSWPVTALHHVGDAEARVFASLGVTTIADLAVLAKEADEAVLAAMEDNGFRERPSAPAQLLPGIIGSVSSSVRFTTFVREAELRKLTFRVNPECAVPLAVSTNLKYPGTPGEIFEQQKCPVLHLGYMAAHHQRWINLGTHLGEVVHSISLAPGESRNIALVNWRRRQLTALEERTSTREYVAATFIQNRALKEITTAVAREHQSGRSQMEANTDVTAASFVAAGGVVGGVAGGVAGAVVGGLSGLAVDVLLMGTDAGAGTITGTIGGGMAGAAVGGAAGMAAGGLVYSGAQALGMIEADTNGDRQIVADVHQRISLSTSQTASAVRSLWSTVVVEDAQAEHVDVQTSNITNYNHMHALNIQYYEVLQHYLTRIALEKVQPILFLPFTFLDFTSFRFIRDYWEAVRPHIEDEGLRNQGDGYFVTEGPPEAPDLLPVPPLPSPPEAIGNLTVTNLRIDVIFKAGDGLIGSLLNLVSDIDLEVLQGQNSLLPNPVDGVHIYQSELNADERGKRFTFATTINNAAAISKIRIVRSQLFNTELRYRVRVNRGQIRRSDGTTLETLNGQNIVSQGMIAASSQSLTFDHSWTPASSAVTASAAAIEQHNQAVVARNEILAENANHLAAYEALVNNIERFKQRLQRLVLRRRHFFTRVILNAIEPEEIIQLLEALRIGHVDAAHPNFGIPLSDIAHTIPLGMTAGGFVLKLKRIDKERLLALAKKIGMDKEVEELLTLLQYADQTLSFFEADKRKETVERTDHIYVPTGGLFAEAILGRSNSAEYLDMERYFNWQDSPIPHQAPAIQPVGTDTRFQQGDVSVNVPEGNLQIINPVSLPDPTGLQGVLTAIQNPNLFRDMSKANELAGIVGNLSTLAGQMGQAASNMTGQAAQQALQSATEVGKAAAQMAQALMNQAFTQTGGAFNSLTSQGAALNQAGKLDQARAAQPAVADGAVPGSGGGSGTVNPGSTGGGGAATAPFSHLPTLQEETFRSFLAAGGNPMLANFPPSFLGVGAQNAPKTALVVFIENTGDLSVLFKHLPVNVPQNVRDALEGLVDYWVEELEKWHLAFGAAGGVHYRQVVFLEDADATEAAFKDTMKQLANKGMLIDVITIGHGSVKRLVGFQDQVTNTSQAITDQTLASLQSEFGGPLPIRAVYMMNCKSGSMNPHWIDLGATVSAGSDGDNFMPEPWMHFFWNNWKAGLPFGEAVRKGYNDSKNYWLVAYQALEAVGIQVNGKSATDLINDSAPVFAGDQSVSIRVVPLSTEGVFGPVPV